MYTATQISATPRGFVVASLYLQPVRTKLVRLFYAAYASDQIKRSTELLALETVLLSNSADAASHPVLLLSKRFSEKSDSVTPAEAEFVYSLLSYTPATEDSKIHRLVIRDTVVFRIRERVTHELCRILIACPVEGLAENSDFLETIISILAQADQQTDLITAYIIPVIVKIVTGGSESDISILQKASHNVFLGLGELLGSNENDSVSVFTMRQSAMSVISAAVALSPDPLALLNLRQGQTDKTLSQKVFLVLFEELMYELDSRTHGLPVSYSKFAEMRARRIRDAICVLARLGSLHSDFPSTNKVSPLDEYALFIPSLFGLVKSLTVKQAEQTAAIDEVITELLHGDLLFIKELSNPKIVGTSFEIEQSVW